MNTILFLRLFTEVDTEASALEVAKRIIALIIKFAKVENQSVQKYWKIPEYYEIFFKLSSLHNLPEDYQSILEILGTGWEQASDYESIWNPGDGKKFFVEEVKWAHLEGEGE